MPPGAKTQHPTTATSPARHPMLAFIQAARRGQRGATAVFVALCFLVFMAIAGLMVDLANLLYAKNRLQTALDAAATAGAWALPMNPTKARADALEFAAANLPGLVPDINFYCVVAVDAANGRPKPYQIPSTCNPTGYVALTYPGMVCDTKRCQIPCNPAADPSITCNAIRVGDEKQVDYLFMPLFGIPHGSTGGQVSMACKGDCGNSDPNPMDVVVIADRTRSMSSSDLSTMKTGILGMMSTMNPEQQYLAFGAIQKSTPTASCPSAPSTDGIYPNPGSERGPLSGTWIAAPFSNTYNSLSTLNTNDTVYKAVNCLSLPVNTSSWGTMLASPMKAATRYVLGMDPNNLGSLPVRVNPYTGVPLYVTKAIILETDGMPDESYLGGTTDITDRSTRSYKSMNYAGTGSAAWTNQTSSSGDVGAGLSLSYLSAPTTPNAGENACTNLKDVAAQAKARGIVVITIAYGAATNSACQRTGATTTTGTPVTSVLANVASAQPDGTPSVADNSCSTTAGANAENSDRDYFFCAASATQLAPIFATAMSQLKRNTTRIIQPLG